MFVVMCPFLRFELRGNGRGSFGTWKKEGEEEGTSKRSLLGWKTLPPVSFLNAANSSYLIIDTQFFIVNSRKVFNFWGFSVKQT